MPWFHKNGMKQCTPNNKSRNSTNSSFEKFLPRDKIQISTHHKKTNTVIKYRIMLVLNRNEKTAASVLFISGNERCHTNDAP